MRQLLSILLLAIWLFANGNLAQVVPSDCSEVAACSEVSECCAIATPEKAGCDSKPENQESSCNDFACLMYCCMNITHADIVEIEAAPWKLNYHVHYACAAMRWKDAIAEVAAPPPWSILMFS